MPLTYYIASTLDGFIAHEDGSFEGFEWDDEVVADFFADLETFGTVLMGRKTYEVGLKEGKTSPYPSMRQIVFSRTMETSPDDAVELVSGDIVDVTRAIKETAESPVWLCGGAEIASVLMDAGLIDHVVVKLNPVVFGSGIPMFAGCARYRPMTLTSTKTYDCGVVLLRYDVPGLS